MPDLSDVGRNILSDKCIMKSTNLTLINAFKVWKGGSYMPLWNVSSKSGLTYLVNAQRLKLVNDSRSNNPFNQVFMKTNKPMKKGKRRK